MWEHHKRAVNPGCGLIQSSEAFPWQEASGKCDGKSETFVGSMLKVPRKSPTHRLWPISSPLASECIAMLLSPQAVSTEGKPTSFTSLSSLPAPLHQDSLPLSPGSSPLSYSSAQEQLSIPQVDSAPLSAKSLTCCMAWERWLSFLELHSLLVPNAGVRLHCP